MKKQEEEIKQLRNQKHKKKRKNNTLGIYGMGLGVTIPKGVTQASCRLKKDVKNLRSRRSRIHPVSLRTTQIGLLTRRAREALGNEFE